MARGVGEVLVRRAVLNLMLVEQKWSGRWAVRNIALASPTCLLFEGFAVSATEVFFPSFLGQDIANNNRQEYYRTSSLS